MNKKARATTGRRTLGGEILLELKELLITGQVIPGERIPIRGTAERLGVSMMPVRQAIYQLAADGALEISPRRSVRVPIMTEDEFLEITQIRLCIEGYAVELACGVMSNKMVTQLRTLNALIAAKMDEGVNSAAEVVALNKQLHFAIYAAANMPTLTKIIERLWLRVGPVLNYDLRSGSKRIQEKTAIVFHDKLIDAIATNNSKAARSALGDDILSAFEFINERMKEQMDCKVED